MTDLLEEQMSTPTIIVNARLDGLRLKKELARLKPAYLKDSSVRCARLDFSPDGVAITVTNLDLWLTATMPAVTTDTASVFIGFNTLTKFVAKVTTKTTHPIEIIQTAEHENRVTLRWGKIAVHLDTVEAKEWPRSPEPTEHAIPQILDIRAAAEVAEATTNDPARPVLQHVCVDGAIYTGTDSYRLYSVESTDSLPGDPWLLPGTMATYLAAQADADVHTVLCKIEPSAERSEHWRSPFVFVTLGNLDVRCRLGDGAFPNWRSLVPTNAKTLVEFERPEITDAIAQLRSMSDVIDAAPQTPIRFEPRDGGGILLRMRSTGEAEVEIKGTLIDGQEIAFSPKYLAEMLDGTNLCSLLGQDPLKPFLLQEPIYVGTEFRGTRTRLIMPVRTH